MHTKGPWGINKFGNVTGADGVTFCTFTCSPNVYPEMMDKAKLIAAAPELLEALEAFVEAYKDHPERLGAGSKAAQHLTKAKELIKKAKYGR